MAICRLEHLGEKSLNAIIHWKFKNMNADYLRKSAKSGTPKVLEVHSLPRILHWRKITRVDNKGPKRDQIFTNGPE